MKLIIPMAGMGKRMRPHTLTVPKPLIRIAGKPIVMRLAEEIVAVSDEHIDEIGFIIGDFGKEVENDLLKIAENLGAKGKIYYQEEALGTAHAISCAAPSLDGKVIVAFADTLFKADFKLDTSKDGIIWVHKVDNPYAFGVVKKNLNGVITDFVEKPKDFVSNEAIIGIYYFKDGKNLMAELQYLMDNNISKGGEFQLTDALENMKVKGMKFYSGAVQEWLDCGNKDATVYTNQRILANNGIEKLVADSSKIINSVIIKPCFIGENVILENCIVGPFVSVGRNTEIKNSVIGNSIIQTNCEISNAVLDNSMIGDFVKYHGQMNSVSIGDYTTLT
ncbi:MAG: nucleotidyltransferase [Bacteroidetes bacterium CG2_30_33_31]|nr:MAG: nucleotidyltransferase [Bacteroidetes bacterium CG2_30_33_31]